MSEESKNFILSKYLNEVEEKIEELKKYHSAEHTLFAYRGESKIYETSLCPTLFRKPEHIHKEIHFFELFRDYSLVSPTASNIEKIIEIQHYAQFTRLIDISFDICTALYFACCSNADEDGQLFLFAFPEHYSPHSDHLNTFYDSLLKGMHSAFSRNFKVFSHCYTNERIKAQKGGFVFFPGKEFFPISEEYYEIVTIKYAHKKNLLNSIELLFNINESTLFPEKEKIAKVVKEKFFSSKALTANISHSEEASIHLARLDYEMNIKIKKSKFEKIPIDINFLQRYIRKERNDLNNYIILNKEKIENFEELSKKINYEFDLLEIKYMGS